MATADVYDIHFDSFCGTRPILQNRETKVTLTIPSLCTLFGGALQQPLFGAMEVASFEIGKSYCNEFGQWAYLEEYMYFLPPLREDLCGKRGMLQDRFFRFSLADWRWETVKQVWFDRNTNILGFFPFESSLLLFVSKHTGNMPVLQLHKFEQERWIYLQHFAFNPHQMYWYSPNEVCAQMSGNEGSVFDARNMTITKQNIKCEAKAYVQTWNKGENEFSQIWNREQKQLREQIQELKTRLSQLQMIVSTLITPSSEKDFNKLSFLTLFGILFLLCVSLNSSSCLFQNKS